MEENDVKHGLGTYDPKLMQLLIRAGLERVEVDAGGRPIVLSLSIYDPFDTTHVKTRWHTLVFPDAETASRYRKIQKMNLRLHSLRSQMRKEAHPQTQAVYKCRISLEEDSGKLVLEPRDAEFDDLLGADGADISAPTLPRDPLDLLDDGGEDGQ